MMPEPNDAVFIQDLAVSRRLYNLMRSEGLDDRQLAAFIRRAEKAQVSFVDIDDAKPSLNPTEDKIGMSMHFSDADPVVVCLVLGCRQHFHGDSRNDAMNAWSSHVSKDHREDW